MTAPKIVVGGATYGLSHRCLLRKLFLTPLTPVVHEGVGFLAMWAAERTQVRIHHLTVMPNHIHLAVTAMLPNIPAFKELFFGEVAKFIKVSLAEHGFEPPERVFTPGAGHQERLIGAAAQMRYLHYEDVNTVSAGLVERVEQYPGLSTDLGLMNGGILTLRPPPFYVDRRRQPAERMHQFSVPPEVAAAYGSARAAVYQLQRMRATKEKALAAKRTRAALGPLQVTRQHPWSEPRSPRRFKPGPVPSFLVVDDDELRVQCALETRDRRQRYAAARKALLAGKPAVFPYGTYKLRVQHGVTVEPVEATEGRVVDAPGPLRLERLSRDRRRELNTSLRDVAATVTQDELDDTLVLRLERAANDNVDRRDGPVQLAADPGEPTPDGTSDGSTRRTKLVVLRGSTATARRRRRAVQRARRSEPVDVDRDHAPHDVEPPFD